MPLFGDAKRGKPISASDLRALAAQSQRGKTAVSGGMGHIVSGGGSGDIPQSAEFFVAQITAVSGTLSSATYGFTEINVVGGTGGTEDRTSGRTGTTTVNPARSVVTGATHAVDDIVLVRRNVASVNEYEIVWVIGELVTEEFNIWRYTWNEETCAMTETEYTVTITGYGLNVTVT